MPVENDPQTVEELNTAWPTGTEPVSEGDDHLRNIKQAVQGTASAQGGDIALLKGYSPSYYLSHGSVGTNGGNANSPGSGDWSSARAEEGVYYITFDAGVPDAPVDDFNQTAMATCRGNAARFVTVDLVSEREWLVYTRNASEVLVDTAFSFIRVTYDEPVFP